MSNEIVVVCTAKSAEHILGDGGTSSWRLDRKRARRCVYAICTRNANSKQVEGTEDHRTAFVIGKVKDVVFSTEPGYEDRYLIQFSEYAQIDVQTKWRRDRNPVMYITLGEMGIDPKSLDWKPMLASGTSHNPAPLANPFSVTGPLTLADAKKGLALTFGVSPDAIEIAIRG